MDWNSIKETLKNIKKEVIYGVLIVLALIFMIRSCTARQTIKRQGVVTEKIITEQSHKIDSLEGVCRSKDDTIKFLKTENEHLNKTNKAKDAVISSQGKTIKTQDKLIKDAEQ